MVSSFVRVPKVESGSFYEPYKPDTSRMHLDTSMDVREFTTWHVKYEFDKNGNYKKTIYKYEDD